jgi:hypothetical protein
MPSSFDSVTPSRFQRRLPGGKHDLIFKVAFGNDAAAARYPRVSRMTVWRWRHDRSPLPQLVTEILSDLLQTRVAEAHRAQQELRDILALPPRPPRPLSGCCAGLERKPRNRSISATCSREEASSVMSEIRWDDQD